jgi:hypothetical protein
MEEIEKLVNKFIRLTSNEAESGWAEDGDELGLVEFQSVMGEYAATFERQLRLDKCVTGSLEGHDLYSNVFNDIDVGTHGTISKAHFRAYFMEKRAFVYQPTGVHDPEAQTHLLTASLLSQSGSHEDDGYGDDFEEEGECVDGYADDFEDDGALRSPCVSTIATRPREATSATTPKSKASRSTQLYVAESAVAGTPLVSASMLVSAFGSTVIDPLLLSAAAAALPRGAGATDRVPTNDTDGIVSEEYVSDGNNRFPASRFEAAVASAAAPSATIVELLNAGGMATNTSTAATATSTLLAGAGHDGRPRVGPDTGTEAHLLAARQLSAAQPRASWASMPPLHPALLATARLQNGLSDEPSTTTEPSSAGPVSARASASELPSFEALSEVDEALLQEVPIPFPLTLVPAAKRLVDFLPEPRNAQSPLVHT